MTDAVIDRTEARPQSSKPSVFIPNWKRQQMDSQIATSDRSIEDGLPTRPPPEYLKPSGRSYSMPKPWTNRPTMNTANLSCPRTPTKGGSWRDSEQESLQSSPAVSTAEAARQAVPADQTLGKAVTVEQKLISPGMYSTWVNILSADIGSTQLSAALNRCEVSLIAQQK